MRHGQTYCEDDCSSRRQARYGFTLIELLVVIAIIALLLTILLPSLNQAKQMALATKCATNLKTCHGGLNLYAEDNHGYLPLSQLPGPNTQSDLDTKRTFPFSWDYWWQVISKFPPNMYGWQAPVQYVTPEATHCTVNAFSLNGDGQVTKGWYGLNHVLAWYNGITDTSYYQIGGYFRIDSAKVPSELYMVCDSGYGAAYISPEMRHMKKHNILWLDGHVKLTGQNVSCWGQHTAPYSIERPMWNTANPYPYGRLDN